MADEVCPLCEGKGAGLPGYFGTMADMFTLLFAFFVLMFSMATMDPAQLPGDGGDKGEGAAEQKQACNENKCPGKTYIIYCRGTISSEFYKNSLDTFID